MELRGQVLGRHLVVPELAVAVGVRGLDDLVIRHFGIRDCRLGYDLGVATGSELKHHVVLGVIAEEAAARRPVNDDLLAIGVEQ
jgi:hypothetical protein